MAVYFQRFVPSVEEGKGKKHKQEHRAGLDLLREGLGREYPLLFSGLNEGDLERELAKEEKGKPFLKNYPQIHLNISHGKDMVVCGIGSSPLGVDVEAIRPVKPTVFRRVLTAEEQDYLEKSKVDFGENGWYRDFFRIWTLKESYAKAVGLGLAADFTRVSFELSAWEEESALQQETAFAPLLFPGRKEEEERKKHGRYGDVFSMREVKGCLQQEWRFFQTIIDREYVISCCVRR